MPAIDITIVRAGDAPPFADIPEDALIHLPDTVWRLAVLQGGMTSGNPSIGLRLDLGELGTVVTEMSVAAWIAATCAMRGAFPASFAGTPLE